MLVCSCGVIRKQWNAKSAKTSQRVVLITNIGTIRALSLLRVPCARLFIWSIDELHALSRLRVPLHDQFVIMLALSRLRVPCAGS